MPQELNYTGVEFNGSYLVQHPTSVNNLWIISILRHIWWGEGGYIRESRDGDKDGYSYSVPPAYFYSLVVKLKLSQSDNQKLATIKAGFMVVSVCPIIHWTHNHIIYSDFSYSQIG